MRLERQRRCVLLNGSFKANAEDKQEQTRELPRRAICFFFTKLLKVCASLQNIMVTVVTEN